MSPSEQVRPPAGRARSTTAAVMALMAAAVVGAVLGYEAVTGRPASDARAADLSVHSRPAPDPPRAPARTVLDGVTVDDGVVPDGVSVFDSEFPAVANLDPALLAALRQAATAAADDDVEFTVTSGWRSPAYQDQLLREAVAQYGSEEEAARWVATAQTSLHVSGDAVDIGDSEARAWLSEHGAEYGLCKTYVNEPWHYELRPGADGEGCPVPYTDPTEDPRMQ